MTLENLDCLAHILSFVPVREREICRLVCSQWRTSADQLARTQHSLAIVGQRDRTCSTPATSPSIRSDDPREPYHLIRWPHNFIRYQCYCLLLDRFPNLRSIRFESIDHWNDHLINELCTHCPSLSNISFVRCLGLGRSRMNETNYLNVTFNGWNKLIHYYGNQVTTLILQDCDLDDRQLHIIITGFRQLVYLDITSNRIVEAKALSQLCPSIRVLKVGPRLIGNISADIPIQPIVAGEGRLVTEIYLQGFLSHNLSLVSSMTNLQKLSIRFMKPLFDDTNMSNCFSVIGQLKHLRSLEIYQHNTHDCYMVLSKDQLLSIFTGCTLLERFVLNCDIWCDSPLDDQIINQMRKSCHRLSHLDLCPGNFQTTDASLDTITTFPCLRYLRIVEFSGITEKGLLRLLHHSPSLEECIVEDCCDIESKQFVQAVTNIYLDNPDRLLKVVITPLRSLQIPTEKIEIPKQNPKLMVTVFGHKDRHKYYLFSQAHKLSSETCSHYSARSIFSLLLNTSTTILTFFYTLFALGIAFFFYLFHFLFFNNRIPIIGAIYDIPYLVTGSFAFIVLALVIAPLLYLLIHLLQIFHNETENLFSQDIFHIYGDSET